MPLLTSSRTTTSRYRTRDRNARPPSRRHDINSTARAQYNQSYVDMATRDEPPLPYGDCDYDNDNDNDYDSDTYVPTISTVSLDQRPNSSRQHLIASQTSKGQTMSTSAWASTSDLSRQRDEAQYSPYSGWQNETVLVNGSSAVQPPDCPIARSLNQGAALFARVAAGLNDVLAGIDSEETDEVENMTRALSLGDSRPRQPTQSTSVVDFKKTWMYANSRLPPHLPPMKIYVPTWQIICLAARASMDVYRRPNKTERRDYVEADWRHGTKAMVIKSQPVDDKNLIIIAIRGTKWNVIDWAVNFRQAPTEPIGFLDDEGNACHAGFLQVARAMISPVAARLRELVQQNPSRATSSLLLTGHSAGGAVASLLYMHMTATSVSSELNDLNGFFRRVHCITFGTPPLSFLPLQNPTGRRHAKNVFLNFANEGDLVVRAEVQYIRTIAGILAAPIPITTSAPQQGPRHKNSRQVLTKQNAQAASKVRPLKWQVPAATLSTAGRIVLLRQKPGHSAAVEAVQVTDEDLRRVVFGDPDMHDMSLYKRRVDELAIAAITGRGVG